MQLVLRARRVVPPMRLLRDRTSTVRDSSQESPALAEAGGLFVMKTLSIGSYRLLYTC